MWSLSIHRANLVNTIPSNIRGPSGKQDDIFSEAHESQSLQLMSNSLTFAGPSVLSYHAGPSYENDLDLRLL